MTNQDMTYHVLLIVILLITTLQCLSVFLSVCSLSAVYRTNVSKKQHWRFHFPPGCGSRLVRLLRFPSLRSNPRTPEMRNLRYVTMSALILPTNTIVRHGLLLLCNSAAVRCTHATKQTTTFFSYFFVIIFQIREKLSKILSDIITYGYWISNIAEIGYWISHLICNSG